MQVQQSPTQQHSPKMEGPITRSMDIISSQTEQSLPRVQDINSVAESMNPEDHHATLKIGRTNASRRRLERKKRRSQKELEIDKEQPLAKTRSKTAAKTALAAPPSMGTQSKRKSFIQTPTPQSSRRSKIKLPELAAAAWQRRTKRRVRRLTRRINRI